VTAAVKGAAYLSTVWCNQLSERNNLFEPSLEPRNKRRQLDKGNNLRRCSSPSVAQLQYQYISHFHNCVLSTFHTAIGPSQTTGQALFINGGGEQGQANVGTSAYIYWLESELFRTVLICLDKPPRPPTFAARSFSDRTRTYRPEPS